jgi:hypothetical protein
MVDFKVFAALMMALAAAACSSAGPQRSPEVAAIDQKCADTASTGDSYRYCVQLGLQEAGLARPGGDEDGPLMALRAR